jgi:hypothetical protein
MLVPLLIVIALVCVLILGFTSGWSVLLIVAAICLLLAVLFGVYPVGPPAPWRRQL